MIKWGMVIKDCFFSKVRFWIDISNDIDKCILSLKTEILFKKFFFCIKCLNLKFPISKHTYW